MEADKKKEIKKLMTKLRKLQGGDAASDDLVDKQSEDYINSIGRSNTQRIEDYYADQSDAAEKIREIIRAASSMDTMGHALGTSNTPIPEKRGGEKFSGDMKDTITGEATNKIKKIIREVSDMNKNGEPYKDYQGAGDYDMCPHCGGKLTLKELKKSVSNIKRRTSAPKKISGGQSDWHKYVAEVAKLPEYKGKPRNLAMKMASKLKGQGMTIQDVIDYVAEQSS